MSRQWRETALSRRDLWTYINWSGADPEEKAKRWLKRSTSTESPSHSAPLHISLCVEEGFEADAHHMEHVMALLTPEIGRWGSFTIHVNREALEVALELCDAAAPILRALSIRCSESEGVEDRFVLFDDRTPALRSLRLVGVPVVWAGPLLQDLTALHLAAYEDGLGPSVEELAVVFARSPLLRRLVLDDAGVSMRAADEFRPETIGLEGLEHLQLTSLDWDVYIWFASNVRMPRVHTYVSNDFDCTAGQDELFAHVEMSFPLPNVENLIALHSKFPNAIPFFHSHRVALFFDADSRAPGSCPIKANVNTGFGHMLLLTSLKRLASIELYYCSVDDSLLETLTWRPEEGRTSCPSLSALKLERCAGFSVAQLKRLVLSRQATDSASRPAALRVVQVIGSTLPVSADDLEWFGDYGVRWFDRGESEKCREHRCGLATSARLE